MDDLDLTEPMRLPRQRTNDGVPLTLEDLEKHLALEKSFGRADTAYTRALEAEIAKRKELGS